MFDKILRKLKLSNVHFNVVYTKLFLNLKIIGFRLDKTTETNKYFKIFLLICDLNVYLTMILMIESCFYANGLLDLIIQLQILSLMAFGLIIKYICYKELDSGIELVNWMKSFYENHEPVSCEAIKKHFRNGPKYSLYLIRFAHVFCFVAFMSIMVLGTIAANLMSTEDEYGLILNINYRWLRPTNLWKFLICFTQEFLATATTAFHYNAFMCLAYTIFLHIILGFNALIEIVEVMDTLHLKFGYDVWIKVIASRIWDLRR